MRLFIHLRHCFLKTISEHNQFQKLYRKRGISANTTNSKIVQEKGHISIKLSLLCVYFSIRREEILVELLKIITMWSTMLACQPQKTHSRNKFDVSLLLFAVYYLLHGLPLFFRKTPSNMQYFQNCRGQNCRGIGATQYYPNFPNFVYTFILEQM